MGYTYKFADNTTYGAADINDTISKIVTGGVAEVFYDGLSYNTSDLNKIAAYITAYGVNPNTATALYVSPYGTGKVKINAGTAFFTDGASVTVDAEGVVLEYTQGAVNYIYAKNNLSTTNTIDFLASTAEPSGDYVPLAQISQDGTITDKRVYCKGKLPGYQSDIGQTKLIDVTYTNIQDQTVTVDLGGYGYSHIIDVTKLDGGTSYGMLMGQYNIKNKTYYCLTKEHSDLITYTDKWMVRPKGATETTNHLSLTFSVSGRTLTCSFKREDSGLIIVCTGTVKLLIC